MDIYRLARDHADVLTPRQQIVLDYIIRHTVDDVAPTITEIATALGVSRNLIVKNIKRLQNKGCLSRGRYSRLRVMDKGFALATVQSKQQWSDATLEDFPAPSVPEIYRRAAVVRAEREVAHV